MTLLRSLFKVLASTTAFAGAVFFSTPAHANGLTLAGEAGPIVVLNKTGNDVSQDWGFGAAGRIGYSIGIPLVSITPEIKLGYIAPGKPQSFMGTAGVRVNFFEVISPAVFAHAGGVAGDLDGFIWDAGLGLDIGLVPFLDLGIFAAYYQVGHATFSGDRVSYASGNWQWLQFGAQAALHF